MLLGNALPVIAGDGHDHGDTAPAATGTALPRFAAVSETFELVGVLVVGTLSLTHPDLFSHDATVWSGYGYGYFWVPLVLPFVGVWWLVRHRHGIPEPEVPQAVIEGSHW